MYNNGRIKTRSPKNVVSGGYAIGDIEHPELEIDSGGSPLERYKKKKKFDQPGYERGKSRTVDYDAGNRQPMPEAGQADNRSYTA